MRVKSMVILFCAINYVSAEIIDEAFFLKNNYTEKITEDTADIIMDGQGNQKKMQHHYAEFKKPSTSHVNSGSKVIKVIVMDTDEYGNVTVYEEDMIITSEPDKQETSLAAASTSTAGEHYDSTAFTYGQEQYKHNTNVPHNQVRDDARRPVEKLVSAASLNSLSSLDKVIEYKGSVASAASSISRGLGNGSSSKINGFDEALKLRQNPLVSKDSKDSYLPPYESNQRANIIVEESPSDRSGTVGVYEPKIHETNTPASSSAPTSTSGISVFDSKKGPASSLTATTSTSPRESFEIIRPNQQYTNISSGDISSTSEQNNKYGPGSSSSVTVPPAAVSNVLGKLKNNIYEPRGPNALNESFASSKGSARAALNVALDGSFKPKQPYGAERRKGSYKQGPENSITYGFLSAVDRATTVGYKKELKPYKPLIYSSVPKGRSRGPRICHRIRKNIIVRLKECLTC